MGDPRGHAATRILVVDDDSSIRLLCRVNFELEGHDHRERSDALVTECHARRPPIPVVLVTGSVDITHPGLSEADAVLPKPFELQQLLSTVRNLAQVHAHR